MKDDSHLYLDRVQLRARGWTRTLIEQFLVRPDRRASVQQLHKGRRVTMDYLEEMMATKWKASRPKMYKEMEDKGLLKEAIEQASEKMVQEMIRLIWRGT